MKVPGKSRKKANMTLVMLKRTLMEKTIPFNGETAF